MRFNTAKIEVMASLGPQQQDSRYNSSHLEVLNQNGYQNIKDQ